MRWLWYVLTGIGVVFVIIFWGDSFPAVFDRRYAKWVELAILTFGLFGYLLKWGWHYRRRARFWKLYSILFLGHCAVFVPLFSHGWWPIPLFAVLAAVEGMVLATVIAWAMGEKF